MFNVKIEEFRRRSEMWKMLPKEILFCYRNDQMEKMAMNGANEGCNSNVFVRQPMQK